jgi:hypothetical protein
MRLTAEIPENRQVVLTLPPDVPTGRADFVVSIESSGQATEPMPAPDVDPSLVRTAFPVRPTHPVLAREYDAFQALLPELLKSYRGQYVAVHDGKVVAHGPDQAEVAIQAYQRCGYQAIYVTMVTDKPQPVPRSGLLREVPVGPKT